jgi:hypothetical protein
MKNLEKQVHLFFDPLVMHDIERIVYVQSISECLIVPQFMQINHFKWGNRFIGEQMLSIRWKMVLRHIFYFIYARK